MKLHRFFPPQVLVALVFLCALYPLASSAQNANPSLRDLPGINAQAAAKLAGKVVLVDFWASWCGPCVRSFPWMKEMQQRYRKDGLVILAVNLDTEAALADEFVKQQKPNFDLLYDPSGRSAEKFGLIAMPTSYLFERDGRLLKRHNGFLEKDRADYEQGIQQALQQK